MKIGGLMWTWISVLLMQDLGYCSPLSGQDLSSCQSTYKSVISQINTAADGVTATVWRLFFHNMDLDGNGHLAASELTLYLEARGYVHESDVMDVLKEAEAWMKFGVVANGELSTKEFKKAVDKSMTQTIARKEAFYQITFSICKIFNLQVPHLIESLTNLESCTKSLEASVHDEGVGEGDFNTWYAIFETLDSNKDNKIGFEELKRSNSDDDGSLASALGHAIYGSVQHGVKDITESNFYVFVHELLYGITGSREHSWSDVYDEIELKGREMLCNVIYDVRKTLTGQRDVMSDCVKSYKATKDRILGADGVFAPEIVFTMADLNRDGQISQEEFDAFIGTTSSSSLYSAIHREHTGKAMRIDDFRSIMPDKIVKPKMEGDVTSKLELSSMTSSKLNEAEMLCHAIIASVQKYPTQNGQIAIDYVNQHMSFKGPGQYIDLPHVEHTPQPPATIPTAEILHVTDHNGEPIEIEIRHPTEQSAHSPPQEESFKGNGHYVPQYDIGITPPAPTRGSQNSESMIYYMYDNDGNPIQIHISGTQLDEIVHEMSQPHSQSSNHTEATPSTTHEKLTTPPGVEEDDGLKSEISKILNKRIKEETDEELRLKKLLASLENGETIQA